MADAVVQPNPEKKAQFTLFCSAVGLEGEKVSTPSGMPAEINGSPCHYIWRRVAKVGDWTNNAQGFTLKLSAAKLEHLKTAGDALLAAGDEVPLVIDHKESGTMTLGYERGYRIDGPWLCALCQVIGDEALSTFNRLYTSVGYQPEYTDPSGKYHGDAIVHIGMTPRPTIIGQEKLKAASQSNARGTIFMSLLDGENPLMDGIMPCSQSQMDQLHSLVHGLADKPAEGKMDHLIGHLKAKATPQAMTMSQAVIDVVPGLKDVAVEGQVEFLVSKIKTMSQLAASVPQAIPQDIVETLRDTVNEILESGVTSGKFSPDDKTKFAAQLVGGKGQSATMFMSASADGSRPAVTQARFLCSITQPAVGGRPVPRNIPGALPATAGKKLPYETIQERAVSNTATINL